MQDTPTHDTPIQILEIRAPVADRPVTVTVAVTAPAGAALLTALGEQLDRRRALPVETAEDILALREHAELLERFAPLAATGESAVLRLTDGELRTCLFELTAYLDRVDVPQYQPPELRERLAVIRELVPVLWDANAEATAAGATAGSLHG